MEGTDPFITIHMVTSLDGRIAARDNDMSWFETTSHYDDGKELTQADMAAFLKTIDCYVMGSRTYEHAVALSAEHGWVYGDVPTIVMTSRNLPMVKPNVTPFSGTPAQLVQEKLRGTYRNVWMVGGARLARTFIRERLADQLSISILPVILGDGLILFDEIERTALDLKAATAYKSGMVELRYLITK